MTLSGEQIDRYSRQILVPEIGGRGQERLLRSTVACFGMSGPLRTAIDYLSAAGVGVLVDAELAEEGAASADLVIAGEYEIAAVQRWSSSHYRCFIVGEAPTVTWYSRHTTTRHCADCIVEGGHKADRPSDSGGSHAISPARVAGAALALDIIAALVDLAPASAAPSLVVFDRGGSARGCVGLEFSPCLHTSGIARTRP